MTEILINNFEYIIKVRERVIIGLCAVAVCFVVCYGFFMEKSASNTAALKAMQSTLAHQNQIVSDLSNQYVSLSQKVTIDSAIAQGFKPASVSAFITVPVTAPALAGPALSINAI
jgi:hypothetical protein